MPGSTPELGLPYPVANDQADVPKDIKALADAVEAVLILRSGEYRQAVSGLSGLTCSGKTGGGDWTSQPTGATTGFPLDVKVACPASKLLAVQVGVYASTPDSNAYADMCYRIYKGGTLLLSEASSRMARLNGETGLAVTITRLSLVTATATPGDLLTVRATFRNGGTAGDVSFSYPNIVVHTRTSQDV